MTERRQPCREAALAAQITPFGRGSDGQSDDQVAVHNGGCAPSQAGRSSQSVKLQSTATRGLMILTADAGRRGPWAI
jgi:hypothetical protein